MNRMDMVWIVGQIILLVCMVAAIVYAFHTFHR